MDLTAFRLVDSTNYSRKKLLGGRFKPKGTTDFSRKKLLGGSLKPKGTTDFSRKKLLGGSPSRRKLKGSRKEAEGN